jgi:hypothetical protein
MSNPVTNLEIEDVLSSIRRLVAEGDKLRASVSRASAPVETAPSPDPWPPQDEAPDAVETPEEPAPPVAKFVLTPAFRVAEPPPTPVLVWDEPEPSEPPEADPVAEVDPELVAVAESQSENLLEDWHGDLAATDFETSPDTEPEMDPGTEAEALAAAMPEDLIPEPVSDSVARRWDLLSDDTLILPEPDVAPEAVPEADIRPQPEGRSRLEATIAELEAAITAKPEEWEPDGSEVTPVMDWAATVAEPAFLSARQAARPNPVEEAEELPQVSGSSWRSRIADDGLMDADEDLSDDLERSPPRARDGQADPAEGPYLPEDHILDEEALRNLVIEIVRQELQGTLGERITRNVRKLVRREIYRVLSSQEFD